MQEGSPEGGDTAGQAIRLAPAGVPHGNVRADGSFLKEDRC